MYDIHPENGIINKGNSCRIKQVMKQAQAKEPVSVAFLGGSITQGSLSSAPDKCYASLVYKWWKEKFPDTDITYINAGIGGTTSQFGVSRVHQHVLSQKPDFILTEFAVNDENDEFFRETYEGLIREMLSDENAPALMLMNNVFYDDRGSAEEQHLMVAKHYDLPMVSMKSTILPQIKNGSIKNRDITPDDLHPNDAGHELVASVIIYMLEQIYRELDAPEEPAKYDTGVINLPAPITANEYQHSVRIKNYNMNTGGNKVILAGFEKDMHEKKEFLDIFSGGFTAGNVGDSISVSAECTGIAIQYRKSVTQPTPVAKAVIDGDEEHPVLLDGNFDEDWGDCLFIETAAKHMPLKEHTVKITVSEAHEDDKVPFYLVSVIVSK